MRKSKTLLFQFVCFFTLSAVMLGNLPAGTFEFSGFGSANQARDMKRKVRASMFLHRATFGPTQADIDDLATQMKLFGVKTACSNWIDTQMALPASLHRDLAVDMMTEQGNDGTEFGDSRYRDHAWYHLALTAPDQLRQRMAWALSQILVINDDNFSSNQLGNGRPEGERLPRSFGPAGFYDLMVTHAFGDYRQLLEEVTYHPVMGVFLSHLRNRKSNGSRFPDENYAREIMQLFSIGLYELKIDGRLKKTGDGELIPTYDNEDIKNFARVFTGLTYAPESRQSRLACVLVRQ